MQKTLIISLIFAILIAIFAIINAAMVTVSFGFAEVQVSLALVILASVAIGAIIMFLIDTLKKIKTSKQVKNLQKQVNELQGELEKTHQKLEEKSMIIENYEKKDVLVYEEKTSKNDSEEKNTELEKENIG